METSISCDEYAIDGGLSKMLLPQTKRNNNVQEKEKGFSSANYIQCSWGYQRHPTDRYRLYFSLSIWSLFCHAQPVPGQSSRKTETMDEDDIPDENLLVAPKMVATHSSPPKPTTRDCLDTQKED